MYLVAACDKNKIAPESIRIVKDEKLALKHLTWLAKNFWPISMSLEDFLKTELFTVMQVRPNSLKDKAKPINKNNIKKWIRNDKFDKITVEVKNERQK